jgi:tetraacyldisaccharide 4'-kinase
MWLVAAWYRQARWLQLLRPIAALFTVLAGWRRQRQSALARPAPVPVIVVGNITVGGTGKTPVVLALIEHLQALGWHPGVLSRGYGGRARHYPLRVDHNTDVRHCGDEVLMLRRHFAGPLVVDPERARGLAALAAGGECDVVISDDGLQHYRLWRDLELVVMDASRGLGNGLCLPAGPLREPPERLSEVDYIVVNGSAQLNCGKRPVGSAPLPWQQFAGGTPVSAVELQAMEWVNVKTRQRVSLAYFMLAHDLLADGPEPQRPLVFALAGIGNPDRFFTTLAQLGIVAQCRALADHHVFTAADLSFAGQHLLLMTEKDAVKIERFAGDNCWYLAVRARLADSLTQAVSSRLDDWRARHQAPAGTTQGE